MKLIAAAALALALGCATMSSSGAPATAQDGSCTPATAPVGTVVYSRPDGNSAAVAEIKDHTPLCASSDVVGYGYRHVKLSDGKEGYILADSLI